MAASRRNYKGSRSNAGTVFWLAAVVVVLFVFAMNWGKIQQTLARTNFHEIVKTQSGSDKTPTTPAASGPQPKAAARPGVAPAADGSQAPADRPPAATSAPKAASPDSGAPGPRSAPAPDTSATAAPATVAPGAAETNPRTVSPASAPIAAARSRTASLYFVRIDDDGVIVRQEAKRQIPVSDSPLLDSLSALLKGPSEEEIRKKLISLVPQGSKLLSAQLRGSTAFLNFNEAFMYNHYGIEGYAGQLKQIVYTATAFPTVQDVQILIEGEKHDYLGGEGVYIGRPLSRNSF
jgi:hypothetical protein